MTEATCKIVGMTYDKESVISVDVEFDAERSPYVIPALADLPWLSGQTLIGVRTWRFTSDAKADSHVKIGLAAFDLISEIGIRAAMRALLTYVTEWRPTPAEQVAH